MTALRAAIDTLDRSILTRLAERRGLIARAAVLKTGNGLPARITDRVEEVVAKVRARSVEVGLDPELIEGFWRQMIEQAIAQEEEVLGR
ncbi:MAG: chorismate mutase [Pseudomonadota bacterium]